MDEKKDQGYHLHRRGFLKGLGVQLLGGALLVARVQAAPKNFNPEHYNRGVGPEGIPDTKGWLISDPNLCVGCRICETVCSVVHENESRPHMGRINIKNGFYGSLAKLQSLPDVCRQCNKADCFLACENEALTIDPKTGARVIDAEKCQGCGECFNACPYDMIKYDDETDTFTKCDLCGGNPACVENCPASAIKFVSLY